MIAPKPSRYEAGEERDGATHGQRVDTNAPAGASLMLADEVDAYYGDLLRRAVEQIEADHQRYHGDACRVCRLIAEIRKHLER